MKRRILTNELLDNLGYNLQCTYRNNAILYESIRPYSMLYWILFKEYDTGFWEKSLYKFIVEKTQIQLVPYINDEGSFSDLILDCLNDKRVGILHSDHFFNVNYINYYKSQHYLHPFILVGCTRNTDELIILDEDINEVKHLDKYYLWPMHEISYSYENLKKLCCNIDIHMVKGDFKNRIYKNNHIFYFSEAKLLSKSLDGRECNVVDIIETYRSFLKTILNQIEQYTSFYLDLLKAFTENERSNENDVLIKTFYAHNKAINVQARFFLLILHDRQNQNYMEFHEFITSNIFPKYIETYNIMVKYALTHKHTYKEKLKVFFSDFATYETHFVSLLLSMLNDTDELAIKFSNINNWRAQK